MLNSDETDNNMLKEEIKGISRLYIIQSLCMLAVVTLIPLLLSLLTNVGDLTAPTVVALVFAAVVETVDALVWGKVRQAGEDGLPHSTPPCRAFVCCWHWQP